MKKTFNFKKIFTFMFLSLFLISCMSSKKEVKGIIDKKDLSSSFVTVKDGKFMYEGEEFRFVGTNNYYMHYKSDYMIDDVINDASEMGITVLRVWGFMDGKEGPAKDHNTYIQTELGVYTIPNGGQSGLERLDYTISKAAEKNIKLVIALTNNWGDFGGMSQYVKWVDGADHHDDFYTNETIKQGYKDYINTVINRKNKYTGKKYNDDPTIMTWELANEPRNESDKTGMTLVKWTDEMSKYVKSIAPNQLVALGDEGFFNRDQNNGFAGEGDWAYTGYSGVDWERLLKIENIDYGTFHLYPEHWGISEEHREQWGTKYILDHINAAKKIGKPVVLEEYGVVEDSHENRLMIYEAWNNAVYDNGGAGSMFWILSGMQDDQQLYENYDGFRIVNDDSVVSQLLTDYAAMMAGGEDTREANVQFAFPKDGSVVKDELLIAAKVFTYEKEIEEVTLTIDGQEVDFEYDADLGYYAVSGDSNEIEDGTRVLEVIAKFTDGTEDSEEIEIEVENNVYYGVGMEYDFSSKSQAERFSQDGGWQAEFGKKGIQWSDSLGNGVMEVNVKFPGANDWEELRIADNDVATLSEYEKVSYEIYIPKVDFTGDNKAFRPYSILNPGWVKVGVDENRKAMKEFPVVKINDKEYYKVEILIDYGVMKEKTEFRIGLVGDKMGYEGPVYVDNIRFYKKMK